VATLAHEPGESITLATEPPFRLGAASVRPALRQLSWDGEHRTLEPRVMQVLVALARAGGEIVGRDELVARCWDGRIVGENAIQRVISLLRALAADSGAFEIETITKVGYRLKAADAEMREAPAAVETRSAPKRRQILLGAAALLVAGAGAGWLSLPSTARREAQRLHAAGLAIQRRDGSTSVQQAIALLERAAAADPSFVPAWADLAYARFELLQYLSEQQHEQHVATIRRAAGRALALEPGNRQALLTLALLKPNFRNWIEVDRELRAALARMPDEPQLHERLGVLYADTGRIRDAATEFQWLYEREPLVPANPVQLARACWYAGDLARAGALLAEARRVAPIDSHVWLSQFNFLLLSGQAGLALAMTRRMTIGLGGYSPLSPEAGVAMAKALDSRRPEDRAAALEAVLAGRRNGRVASFIAVPYLAALGASEEAWQALYAYYFGKRDPVSGERLPLPVFAWRRTDILFSPALAPLRRDPRFAQLTATLGLDRYWQVTGAKPQIP
jgi:DNA-binding winged helix-turn-helix (wHTH) protein